MRVEPTRSSGISAVVIERDPSSEVAPDVVTGGTDAPGAATTEDVVTRAVPAAKVAVTAACSLLAASELGPGLGLVQAFSARAHHATAVALATRRRTCPPILHRAPAARQASHRAGAGRTAWSAGTQP